MNNKHIYYLLTILIAAVVVSFTLFQLRFWILGPQLEIEERYYVVDEASLPIAFQVSNTVRLLVNGVEVVPQIDGHVETILSLSRGTNIISIDLYDKYGGHSRELLYIVYPQEGNKPD